MFSFKVSSLTLSLVLSPFLVFPAVAGGIAQTSGGAPQPGDNTPASLPSSAVNTSNITTSVSGSSATIGDDGQLTVIVPPATAQNLSQAVGLVIAALQTANTPAAQTILNNITTNVGVNAVLSTSETVVEGIIVTENQPGAAAITQELQNMGQVIQALQTFFETGLGVGSSFQIQIGNRTVTLSPIVSEG